MSTASRPLVSVVTPVYNEADYLVECIESLLAQTYREWDYTIVDNCSDDASLEIAVRYSARDSRIRVVRNEQFLPPIANHNVALRQISPASKYCKVILGDDWIFPECLERMVAVAEEHPSIGIVGAYALEGREISWTGLPYPSTVVRGQEICRRHFLDRLYVFGTPNSVLYRADLVRGRDPFYDEADIHADTEVCFALLKGCDFGFVHQVLSFTRVRSASLTAASTSWQTSLSSMLRLLLSHGPDYLSAEELETLLQRHVSMYYRYLGRSLLRGRNREFWQYHKNQLTDAGIGFDRVRLAGATAAVIFDALLNPKHSVERLLKHCGAVLPERTVIRSLDGKWAASRLGRRPRTAAFWRAR